MGRPNHPYTVGGAYRSVPLQCVTRRGSMDFYEDVISMYVLYNVKIVPLFVYFYFCFLLNFPALTKRGLALV